MFLVLKLFIIRNFKSQDFYSIEQTIFLQLHFDVQVSYLRQPYFGFLFWSYSPDVIDSIVTIYNGVGFKL